MFFILKYERWTYIHKRVLFKELLTFGPGNPSPWGPGFPWGPVGPGGP